MNPWYRSYTRGNPSYVISRHGAQFFAVVTRASRGCFRVEDLFTFRFVSFRFKANKESLKLLL